MLYQNICVFPCISHRFFVPLYLLTIHVHLWTKLFKLCKFISLTNNHYATKPLFNYGPHWARPTLFPQHSAANRLAETPRSSCRRSASWAPHETQASHIPPCGSKHYLPTSRESITARFRLFRRLRVSLAQTPTFLTWNQDFQVRKVPFCRGVFLVSFCRHPIVNIFIKIRTYAVMHLCTSDIYILSFWKFKHTFIL